MESRAILVSPIAIWPSPDPSEPPDRMHTVRPVRTRRMARPRTVRNPCCLQRRCQKIFQTNERPLHSPARRPIHFVVVTYLLPGKCHIAHVLGYHDIHPQQCRREMSDRGFTVRIDFQEQPKRLWIIPCFVRGYCLYRFGVVWCRPWKCARRIYRVSAHLIGPRGAARRASPRPYLLLFGLSVDLACAFDDGDGFPCVQPHNVKSARSR
jgi:hypothetical protein